MPRASAASGAIAALLVLAPAASATDREFLERHRPELRYDSGEELRATGVRDDGADVAYGRAARGGDGRRWLQYWLYYTDNPQDRGSCAPDGTRATGSWCRCASAVTAGRTA